MSTYSLRTWDQEMIANPGLQDEFREVSKSVFLYEYEFMATKLMVRFIYLCRGFIFYLRGNSFLR